MAESQIDIDMAMHELGQRLRAAWNKEHVVPVGILEIARNEARNQWEIEHQIEWELKKHAREAPQIEPPRIEPPDPDLGR